MDQELSRMNKAKGVKARQEDPDLSPWTDSPSAIPKKMREPIPGLVRSHPGELLGSQVGGF